MNVLSVFDGISCGRVALERAVINVNNYYASEIDNKANLISNNNYPDIMRLGDITKIDGNAFDNKILPAIDLFIGGSPCQGFSAVGKNLNFNDPRSKLFFEYVRILKQLKKHNPKIKFLLENVRMKKEYLNVITDALGVKPILINSSLVSAQSRQRYYWTNIQDIKTPVDKKILLNSILEKNPSKIFNVKTEKHLAYINKRLNKQFTAISPRKSLALLTRDYENWNGTYIKNNDPVTKPFDLRKLTPIECERLQNLPDNYTKGVINKHRYHVLGNGWTVDVIVHIFEGLKV